MIFGLICILLLVGVILVLPNGGSDQHLHKITRLPVLESKDQIESLKKARISPDRFLIEEMQKEDRFISGPFGVASESIDLRTPYHISSFKQQNEVQSILNLLKQTMDEDEYIRLRNKMEDISRQQRVNVREVLTKFQWKVLQAMASGQAIPTATAQDAIRDEKLTYEELKKLLPQFQKVDEKPVLFNHRAFSIQTRPGSTEKAIESAFETSDENVKA